jgi:hypothetical protein
VKVADGVALEMATLTGVKVPPAPPSFGVTVTVPVIKPLAATVKLVDAALVAPLVGPLSVTAVAGAGNAYAPASQLAP